MAKTQRIIEHPDDLIAGRGYIAVWNGQKFKARFLRLVLDRPNMKGLTIEFELRSGETFFASWTAMRWIEVTNG